MNKLEPVVVIQKEFPRGHAIPQPPPGEFDFSDVAAAVSESQQINRRDLLDSVRGGLARAKTEAEKRAVARIWNQHLKDTK